jgi:hypothetical protein
MSPRVAMSSAVDRVFAMTVSLDQKVDDQFQDRRLRQ